MLSALADALRLAPSERVHLHRLTKSADMGFNCMGGAQPPREVRPAVRAILDRLEPAPAVVVNRLTDVLAHTDGYQRLMAPFGLFDTTSANLARFVFTDPRARTAYPDWNHIADHTVATLKHGPFRKDPHIAGLADELTVTVGPDFTNRVETVPSLPAATGITRLAHPAAGQLRLAYEILDLSADDDQHLIVHLPADETTATALDKLAGLRPGALHAV